MALYDIFYIILCIYINHANKSEVEANFQQFEKL